ncbi:MAG: hypothetical protein IKK33_04595 [Lachnospiraceae bacterium]|nr:hypothetical protein [Lachnospiraceae bacterium]
MKKSTNVVLNDGRDILLMDDEDISILINGEKVYTMPYPMAGYGGGILIVSPAEKYLVFSYFSGQSQEAFILFDIAEMGWNIVYEHAYFGGEGSNYFFINDEKILVEAKRTGWWSKEDSETDIEGKSYYEFGELNFLDINDGNFTLNKIFVYPTDSWEENVTDNGYIDDLEVLGENSFSLKLPWGVEEIELLTSNIIIRYLGE